MKIYSILFISSCVFSGLLNAETYPALYPPYMFAEELMQYESGTRLAKTGEPTREWLLHKTEDGLHPNGVEQQLLWLMNNARLDPKEEGIFLATSQEPDVAGGRRSFRVDVALLQEEFNAYAIKAPAAFDRRLYLAALTHSLDLISRDAQDHNNQFDYINDEGFSFTGVRGNVFSFAKNGLNAHAAFNIDWGGNDASGMQAGRGHRKAIMSLDADYTNVGIASVEESSPVTKVGPLVITENFAHAQNVNDHHNRFLVGTAWKDENSNQRFDAGEGLANVKVMPNQGEFYAVTSVGGGFAIPVLQEGNYTVTFSGGDLSLVSFRSVTLSEQSELLDYKPGYDEESLEQSGRLFVWAEANFSQYFSPPNQETMDFDGFIFRYYPDKDNYLATKDGRVYVLGGVFGGLLDVGAVTDYVN